MKTRALSLSLLALFTLASAQAGERSKSATKKSAPTAAPADTADQAEQLNVEKIKEKYWAKGDENAMGVVQNRLYSKSNRIQFGFFFGAVNNDPFLSINNWGFNLTYHLSEYWGLALLYWKDMAKSSQALTTLEAIPPGNTTSTNPPYYFVGIEALYSVLYGKLSVLGKAIIYYDMHVAAGGGMTFTEGGNYITPMVGVGQRFFLDNHWSLRFDYRFQLYRETLYEKQIGNPSYGQPVMQRNNMGHIILLGVDFMFGQ